VSATFLTRNLQRPSGTVGAFPNRSPSGAWCRCVWFGGSDVVVAFHLGGRCGIKSLNPNCLYRSGVLNSVAVATIATLPTNQPWQAWQSVGAPI
jgi:hypothetical protein